VESTGSTALKKVKESRGYGGTSHFRSYVWVATCYIEGKEKKQTTPTSTMFRRENPGKPAASEKSQKRGRRKSPKRQRRRQGRASLWTVGTKERDEGQMLTGKGYERGKKTTTKA